MDEQQRHKDMIEETVTQYGYPIQSWETDPDDGNIRADLGRFRVLADDENAGLYEGDEGVVYASVVGAQKYGNERVDFQFQGDDFDTGLPLRDLAMQVEGI